MCWVCVTGLIGLFGEFWFCEVWLCLFLKGRKKEEPLSIWTCACFHYFICLFTKEISEILCSWQLLSVLSTSVFLPTLEECLLISVA